MRSSVLWKVLQEPGYATWVLPTPTSKHKMS